MFHTHRVPARAMLAGGGLVLALATAACSSNAGSEPAPTSPSRSATGATGATAQVGDLQIIGAYIRKPTRPTSAAAYLTIVNNGGVDDTLVRASTDVTPMVEPMTEFMRDGKKGMAPIAKLVIPAHGRTDITPGNKHLMLMNQNRALQVGEKVTMTLTFAHAGTVTFSLPVAPLVGAGPAASESAAMSNMPGMG